MRNKKGNLSFMQTLIWGVLLISISVAIALMISQSFTDSEGLRSLSTTNESTTLNTNSNASLTCNPVTNIASFSNASGTLWTTANLTIASYGSTTSNSLISITETESPDLSNTSYSIVYTCLNVTSASLAMNTSLIALATIPDWLSTIIIIGIAVVLIGMLGYLGVFGKKGAR